MEKIIVEATKSSPRVILDPDACVLTMSGQSYPENASDFYEPILNWTESYLKSISEEQEVVINMTIEYFNTSSSKALMDFFDLVNDAYNEGKNVVVNWYYHEENELAQECGEEFDEDLDVMFNLLQVNE